MSLLPCCIVSPSLFPSLRRRAKELLSHLVSCRRRRRASMDTHSLRNSASTKRGEIYEKTFSYRVAPSNSYHFARRIYSRMMLITPQETRQFPMMKGNLIRFLLLWEAIASWWRGQILTSPPGGEVKCLIL